MGRKSKRFRQQAPASWWVSWRRRKEKSKAGTGVNSEETESCIPRSSLMDHFGREREKLRYIRTQAGIQKDWGEKKCGLR